MDKFDMTQVHEVVREEFVVCLHPRFLSRHGCGVVQERKIRDRGGFGHFGRASPEPEDSVSGDNASDRHGSVLGNDFGEGVVNTVPSLVEGETVISASNRVSAAFTPAEGSETVGTAVQNHRILTVLSAVDEPGLVEKCSR